MPNIRITSALHDLLKQTAAHRKMDVSEVIRRTANGIRNNRTVVHFELQNMYHEKPETVLKVRGLIMPDIPPAEFRRLLALRCLEELAKPETVKRKQEIPEQCGYILDEHRQE